MTELLKTLCLLDSTSGDESAVRDFVISQISKRKNKKETTHNNV